MEVKFATQLRIIRKKLIATFLVFSHIPTGCTLHISWTIVSCAGDNQSPNRRLPMKRAGRPLTALWPCRWPCDGYVLRRSCAGLRWLGRQRTWTRAYGGQAVCRTSWGCSPGKKVCHRAGTGKGRNETLVQPRHCQCHFSWCKVKAMASGIYSSWARTYTGRMQIFQLCRCRIPRILSKFVPEKRIS